MAYYTVKQVAERLSVSAGTIYGEIAVGRISVSRFGRGRGAIRISEDSLREYEIGCAEESEPPKTYRHLKL